MDKDKTIAQVYNDPLGFGSNRNTLKDAHKIDSTITLEDIIKWKESHVERTTQLKGYNSYIANGPYEQYQVDLFFMNAFHEQDYKVALLMVDVFTKDTEVLPLKNKGERQIRSIRDMLHKRMKNSDDDQWSDHIGYVLLTYNHKMKHNTTHMTP